MSKMLTRFDSLLSGHPEIGFFPACAPEDLSNDRFYDALTGDVWFVNATDYGHIDFFDFVVTSANDVK